MQFKVYCQNIEQNWNHGKSADLMVYHGLADCFVNKIPFLFDFLSDSEKSKAERFKRETDYSCYVTVHALLRVELSKHLKTKARSIKIGESECGKPFIPGEDLPFSLSRTKNLFAFVVGKSNQFLGIDIEQIKPEIDFASIAYNYFSVREQQMVLSQSNITDQKRIFFEIWTRKEALLKAIGIGLNTDLNKVQVLDGGNMLELDGVEISNHSFKIATTQKKEALISIASSKDFVPEFKNLSFVL
jgi:4'-phosphopantetheinyl transferase